MSLIAAVFVIFMHSIQCDKARQGDLGRQEAVTSFYPPWVEQLIITKLSKSAPNENLRWLTTVILLECTSPTGQNWTEPWDPPLCPDMSHNLLQPGLAGHPLYLPHHSPHHQDTLLHLSGTGHCQYLLGSITTQTWTTRWWTTRAGWRGRTQSRPASPSPETKGKTHMTILNPSSLGRMTGKFLLLYSKKLI